MKRPEVIIAGFDRVEIKLDALALGFTKLEERVAHLPTKGFTVTALLTILTLLTAITLFQGKIQGFLGLVGR